MIPSQSQLHLRQIGKGFYGKIWEGKTTKPTRILPKIQRSDPF